MTRPNNPRKPKVNPTHAALRRWLAHTGMDNPVPLEPAPTKSQPGGNLAHDPEEG
jgi:hypothetical protein